MASIKVADLGGATMEMIDVGRPDFIHPKFMKTGQETKEMFDNIPNFDFRTDDVMLCTYPKTGTHWMYELIKMAQEKSAERVKTGKVMTMFEAVTADEINQHPSPRVVNAHFPFRFLPLKGLRNKQIKTVLCLRNPKDTAVSYYNHMRGVKAYDYTGKWEDWLPVYLDGKLEYGKYTTWLKEWETQIKNGVGFPLHVLYYEDLKTNCRAEYKKLMDFLEIDIPEDLQAKIIANCGFHKMAPTKYEGPVKDMFFKKDFNLFRKGEIGDWRNWFTIAQNDMFEELWSSEMRDSTMFNFKYSSSAEL